MSRVVFDIETIGVDFEELNADAQKYILKGAEDESKAKETKTKLGLWPLTGQIAAICLFNPDTEKGKVFFQAPGKKISPAVENGIQYEPVTEKEILQKFWQEIRNYDQFVTFNGRSFDCPYILLRSAALRVRPTTNLMPNRYDARTHVDLLDQLTFYGAFRKFSLDFYCKSFGLKNAKTEGMSGDKVQDFFKQKKFKEIASYCADDVRATAELFALWENYVKF
ncbi:MAG: ribonuclease H-like domain-containing protein [Candidatus Portnoybacteria bacterium]|jgi:hypothetical protein|nr:ribonuclease H-like domain-containing protein [Candidatus Portnoybacteria bacterium]